MSNDDSGSLSSADSGHSTPVPNEQTQRCLVTGSTGYVGRRLVPPLLERGYTVRAMARNPDKLSDAPWRDSAEVVRGDLSDPDSLMFSTEPGQSWLWIAACAGMTMVMGVAEGFDRRR